MCLCVCMSVRARGRCESGSISVQYPLQEQVGFVRKRKAKKGHRAALSAMRDLDKLTS